MKGTRVFAVIAAVVILLAGCEKKSDPIAHAERQSDAKGFSAPSIAETKAIAEKGFIYGLPIVMNYAVMYEYAVDTKSRQYKAPFNQIYRIAPHRCALEVRPMPAVDLEIPPQLAPDTQSRRKRGSTRTSGDITAQHRPKGSSNWNGGRSSRIPAASMRVGRA
jgi:hypothetical protein